VRINWSRQAHNGFEHPVVEGFVERSSDTAQDSSPDQVEDTLGDVQSPGEDHQTDKGRYAPAWEHPVIDLQHEDDPVR
jgi:hypothetical protein